MWRLTQTRRGVATRLVKPTGACDTMFETILITLALIVIGVNVATTVSPKFRRWVYSKEAE